MDADLRSAQATESAEKRRVNSNRADFSADEIRGFVARVPYIKKREADGPSARRDDDVLVEVVDFVAENVSHRSSYPNGPPDVFPREDVVNCRVYRRFGGDVSDDIDGKTVRIDESDGEVIGERDRSTSCANLVADVDELLRPKRLVNEFDVAVGCFGNEILGMSPCAPDDRRLNGEINACLAVESEAWQKVCRVCHDTAAPRGGRRKCKQYDWKFHIGIIP